MIHPPHVHPATRMALRWTGRFLLLTGLILFSLTAAPQTILQCSGTVTEAGSGFPVANHAIAIVSDSLPGTTLHFSDTVFTDQQGHYTGSFTLTPAMLSGHVVIKTAACNSTTAAAYLPFGNQAGYNLQHDFQICLTDTTCQADFDYQENTPLLVQFTDLSTGVGNGTRLWTFGDGTSSSMINPVHHFYDEGFYTVSLTISNNSTGCQDYISKTIMVGDTTPGCQANFLQTVNPVNPLDIQFTDESTGQLYSWRWDFGDNGSSALQNPNHIYATEGIYNVCLTITGADSCHQTLCRTITVHAAGECQAQFSYHPDLLTVPPGIPYQFIDLSTGPIDHWDWSFGDGNSSHQQNPLHTFSGPGTYFVCLTVYGGGCQSAWCQYIEVTGTDTCFTYYTFQLAGLSASFSGFLMNSLQAGYEWDFGDGSFATGQNVTHAFTMAGIYPVTLHAVDSAGCSATYQQTVTIGDNPPYHQVYGQAFAGNFPLRSGTVMLFALDTIQSFYPFVASSLIDTNGVYYFSMVPEGSYYVYALPGIDDGYLPTYYGDVQEWTAAPVLLPAQVTNPCHIHFMNSDTLGSGNGTILWEVQVAGLRYDLLSKIVMLLKDEEGKTLGFQVVNNAGAFEFPTLPLGTYFLKGELPGVFSDLIKVVLTAEAPEVTVSMTFTGNHLIGINDPAGSVEIATLYPNPVLSTATLQVRVTDAVTAEINLTTLTGQNRLHRTITFMAGINETSLDLSHLSSGVYLLEIKTPEHLRLMKKIIKL